MREAQQAEIIHIHLGARGFETAAVADAVAAMEIRIVDDDIDLAADRSGEVRDRPRVGEIERNDGDLRKLCERVEAGRHLPRFGDAGPDDVGLGLDEGLHQRLSGCALRICDEDFSHLRIGGHLTQHPVVGHVRRVGCGKRDQRGLTGLVEMRAYAHRCRLVRLRRWAIAVQMHEHGDVFLKTDKAEPQRHARAVIEFVGVMQQRLGNEIAASGDGRPFEAHGEAVRAGIARRILHLSAIVAGLQVEAALGNRGGHAQSRAAARCGWQCRQPQRQDRVARGGALECVGHVTPARGWRRRCKCRDRN